jgi:hypothetical protein
MRLLTGDWGDPDREGSFMRPAFGSEEEAVGLLRPIPLPLIGARDLTDISIKKAPLCCFMFLAAPVTEEERGGENNNVSHLD